MTSSQSNLLWIVLGCSVFALLFATWLARWVLARGRGTPEMQRISDAMAARLRDVDGHREAAEDEHVHGRGDLDELGVVLDGPQPRVDL